MDGCQLWTPENPFLYGLELCTFDDNSNTRFGMRTFVAIKDNGVFWLNDKSYYIRGTNVCISDFLKIPTGTVYWDSNGSQSCTTGLRKCIGKASAITFVFHRKDGTKLLTA